MEANCAEEDCSDTNVRGYAVTGPDDIEYLCPYHRVLQLAQTANAMSIGLTNEQRLEVFATARDGYCDLCGRKEDRGQTCQCGNDE